MQTGVAEGRSVVSISPSGDISINPAAIGAKQASASGKNSAVDIGEVLNEITQALEKLLKLSSQQGAISQRPSLFSAPAASSSAELDSIGPSLAGISQKLANPSPSVSSYQAPDADWPYPDLGSSPFMNSPTGNGPTGSFGFNPTYFPTRETAETIAQMLGGKVVPQTAILSSPGSPFHQDQLNYMVELPNGNVINPGFIAQAIASKQPRSTIDALIYSEVNNTGIAAGQAPPFVPVNAGATKRTSVPTPSTRIVPSTPWFSIDQLSTHLYSTPGSGTAADDAAGSIQARLESALKMLQLLSHLVASRQAVQPDTLALRSMSK
jgi:hypothetical protein